MSTTGLLIGLALMGIGIGMFIWLKGKKANVGMFVLVVGLLVLLGVIPT